MDWFYLSFNFRFIKVKSAFENLRFNKILLTEADIRDRKLDKILDENL